MEILSSDLVQELLGAEVLFDELRVGKRSGNWSGELWEQCLAAFDPKKNGHIPRWLETLQGLPQVRAERVSFQQDAVRCSGSLSPQKETAVKESLWALRPWRKGPFQIFDTFVDTEWRSFLKWDRLQPHLNFSEADVLDVGCGNGYYGYRMLGAGARRVVGLDPNLLYVFQAAALRHFLGPYPNYVLPVGDQAIRNNLRIFDIALSMGVLYHRKSPIEHLQLMGHSLKPDGLLVLETLVIEGDDFQVLVPEDRYAMMNNVWFLPTCRLLERMLIRCGFRDVRVVDVTATTLEEQRATEWMQYDSLDSFLHPENPKLTAEGYPAPLRAILLARRT